ncbi:fumarylacetoacetate hydrolase family protein [Bacillus aquiflavi]|uniref:2-keto-4-pentenoate hydratase n=1 Tax=Bacillus aquiflavi TaxID=2672567 RepID=A0A6B3W330_9BACI|nr:fumarylacetoacetate hydrolase family protein [Bacillus aquiflavi]MBA4538025.1 fumarylacetoacetate hydrolase family protein [Bacillus aquiflavi]NEY82281.1 2-keto-4-pentenoate hydratase [Bacillus aquiflavi]UAC48809.1 fumarylacetoacetate hydrolase family protein [Bacillus aquiflavi]
MNHAEIAKRLLEAERTKQAIEPLTTTFPEITVDDAYRIQIEQIDYRVTEGARIVGKKIGLTSDVMQRMFNVTTPDYGHLLDDMMCVEGEPINTTNFLSPKLECEIAFVLKEDLQGPGVTEDDVVKATDYVVPAFEVIDSRIRDWKIRFEDTVSDNGSSARAILGGKPTSLTGLDLHHIGMVFTKNGEIIDTAAGAAVMGNPLRAVAWLANALGEYGIALKKGEVILSGALTGAVPVQTGEIYTAEFAHIGSVTVQFSEGDH